MPAPAPTTNAPTRAIAGVSMGRRTLLAGAAAVPAALALAACTGDQEQPPVDPDRVQLEAARDVETQLLAVLQASSTSVPDADRAVREHLDALGRALGESTTAPSASPPASPSASTSSTSGATSPAAAADHATDQHTRALRTASSSITPLLASIAASDAAVAAGLRSSS